MVPSPVFLLRCHELGLMGKGLEGALSFLLQTLQIPSEVEKTAPLALAER